MSEHLKPEEFVNLTEGVELPPKHRAHLHSCADCSAVSKLLRSVGGGMNTLAAGVPEPDWNEFRNSVRTALLSRSVQRASTVRQWRIRPIRPATVWGLSVVLAVAVTTGGFLWEMQRERASTILPETATDAPARLQYDFDLIDAEIAVWQTDLFDKLINLERHEQEELQRMLAAAQQARVQQQ